MSIFILVKRKPIDVSFSKVMNSITNSIKSNRSSSEKGSSENFYSNALMKNSTLAIEISDLEESSLQLSESRRRINYPSFSDDDDDEDTTEALSKAYRRHSLLPPTSSITTTSIATTSIATSSVASSVASSVVSSIVPTDAPTATTHTTTASELHEETLDHLELEVSSDEPDSNIIQCRTIASSVNSQYGLDDIVY